MSFSNNLKNIRSEKNLSQEQLAELVGVSRQAVSKWEQDGGYPETEKLVQIAKKLDVSLDMLLLDKQSTDMENNNSAKNIAFFGERKIMIQTFDGKAMSAFYKFTIMPIAFPGKNEPKCILCGTDKSSFWGDNLATLGWYVSIEDAQKEIDDICIAMQNGETVYNLKHHAKVKIKMFNVVLDNDTNR